MRSTRARGSTTHWACSLPLEDGSGGQLRSTSTHLKSAASLRSDFKTHRLFRPRLRRSRSINWMSLIVDTILLRPDVPFISSAEVVRVGAPPNPDAFLPGVSGGPVIGETWDPVIDHTTFVPGAILDVFAISLSAANEPVPPFGTLLCGPSLLVRFRAPGNPFNLPIPDDSTLAGLTLCASGGSFDQAVDFFLTNALDITIGNF